MIPKKRRPATPGEVLLKDFLEPLGLNQNQAQDAFAFADAMMVVRERKP